MTSRLTSKSADPIRSEPSRTVGRSCAVAKVTVSWRSNHVADAFINVRRVAGARPHLILRTRCQGDRAGVRVARVPRPPGGRARRIGRGSARRPAAAAAASGLTTRVRSSSTTLSRTDAGNDLSH